MERWRLSEKAMRILIPTDGSENAHRAALFGGLIARAAHADVTLLGVAENDRQREALDSALYTLAREIAADGQCRVEPKVRQGFPDEQILAEAEEHFFHLVVVGSQGGKKRGLTTVGSTARRLAQFVKSPLLIVTNPPQQIRRALICTSGEKPGESDAYVGGALAALVGAEATVLHVMSQVALGEAARMEDLERDAPQLIESGAREGEHLKRTLEIMTGQGLMPSRCHARVRHGLVLDEILAEIREGAYDLIVIGAHQVPDDSFKGLRELFQENMADRILTHAKRPVLVVRALTPGEWTISGEKSEAGAG